jgi:hypothetical protein
MIAKTYVQQGVEKLLRLPATFFNNLPVLVRNRRSKARLFHVSGAHFIHTFGRDCAIFAD